MTLLSNHSGEYAGECVKLKTVTEIRRSSARDTFVEESVFDLNSLPLDWEPVERLKRGVVWLVLRVLCVCFFFLSLQYEASSIVSRMATVKSVSTKCTFVEARFSGDTEASPLTQL